ncbi:uncharacterized protein LOC120767825 [Bactrocera tryoni]|uniref:uncharacterized protein LOC120767825 n=1 Tax=Bactrocera tryoni TaxID=59916 RepID=UPI001A95AAE5|nr:uncharacterized protein LOC120767825 [Bactrocera tryoni]
MDIEEIESDDDAVDAVLDELGDNISVVMECRRGVYSTIRKSDIWRNNILTTLDEDRFRQMLRVDRDQYNMLVDLIKNDDARIYRNSSLFQQNEQHFSSLQWIAGDSAYPLSGMLITPYRSNARHLDKNARIAFNLRHSKYRVGVEHCSGVLKERFGSLKQLRMHPSTTTEDSIEPDEHIPNNVGETT